MEMEDYVVHDVRERKDLQFFPDVSDNGMGDTPELLVHLMDVRTGEYDGLRMSVEEAENLGQWLIRYSRNAEHNLLRGRLKDKLTRVESAVLCGPHSSQQLETLMEHLTRFLEPQD